MATIDNAGRVAYMYDDDTDTWFAVAGKSNTAASYSWSGSHTHSSVVTFQDVVTAQAGVNNFQNPSARDSAISSPSNGAVCFVRQSNSGDQINQLQYYYNGSWKNAFGNVGLSTNTSNYTIKQEDAGRTIVMDMSVANVVTVPEFSSVPFAPGETVNIIQAGLGQTEIQGQSASVIINSKSGFKKLIDRYAGATLVNVSQNNWILIGDLVP